MKTLLRTLTVLLAALLGALPLIGGGGGEGANGAGGVIWLLPSSRSCISGSPIVHTIEPRATFLLQDLNRDYTLQMDTTLGEAVATCTESISREMHFLPVNGHALTLPRTVLRSLFEARAPRADILVLDPDRRGYVMVLLFDLQNRTAELRVY